MKIVSWNCNGAFRKKRFALDEFDADVLVIQECENPGISSDLDYSAWATNYLWVGSVPYKGLGVFAKPELELKQILLPPNDFELFLPCKIGSDISMLAVWTQAGINREQGYIGQLWRYLQLNSSCLTEVNSILIGDLNSNQRWDKKRESGNHSQVVDYLEGIGLQSLYHSQMTEAHGKESTPTFFMYRKLERPYHIDYAFCSDAISKKSARLEIASPEKWLVMSDHVPLTLHIDNC